MPLWWEIIERCKSWMQVIRIKEHLSIELCIHYTYISYNNMQNQSQSKIMEKPQNDWPVWLILSKWMWVSQKSAKKLGTKSNIWVLTLLTTFLHHSCQQFLLSYQLHVNECKKQQMPLQSKWKTNFNLHT